MAYLLLRLNDGSTEKIGLSRSQPITVGRQSFNDICIPEDTVQPFHCRFGWSKSKFEVTSATSSGIEVNSTAVVHSDLKSGDVIRVGSFDIVFYADDEEAADSRKVSQNTRKSPQKTETSNKPVEDLSLFDGLVQSESEEFLEALFDDEAIEDSEAVVPQRDELSPSTLIGNPSGKRTRPGEQEVIRSPLVLGLTAGGCFLLLVTGILWFLLGREQSNGMYQRAVAELENGQFVQSISSFERFIQQYPSHSLRKQANRNLAKALVLKEISGSAPAWKRGLERLNELIKSHRSESDFSEMNTTLFEYADQIAFGSAKSAETARDAELLVVSKEAQELLERYANPSTPLDGTVGRIVEQQKKADRAIAKQKTFDLAMKVVDDSLSNQDPMAALSERERLVKLFPDFANTKRVKDVLVKSLDLERSVVSVDDTERNSETTDRATTESSPVLGILHARSRSDEASQGRIVFVLAKDSCYGVDATTGELVWRRVIGTNSPFFPLKYSGSKSSVLLFESQKQALIACDITSGALLWRQPLNARAIAHPLVHEGQIYLPLDGHSLVRIDAETGRLSANVRFSQNLATTPVLSRSGEYLLIPGEMSMIYSLTLHSTSNRSSLSAVATTFTDHAAGSVTAPPLLMGNLLLLCENDRADSAALRLWDATAPAELLKELATTRTAGQVRDTPVLRGNVLVVPSAGEQFAAFAVTDEPGKGGIAPIGQYRADQAQSSKLSNVPVFISLGPDGQFWSASSAFRRFEIISDNIRMDSNSTAAGVASQPLQRFGDYFFVGRKSRFSDAVTFSAVEHEKLVSPWRCVVGDTPLEMLSTRDGGIFWVGESGTLYTIGKNRIAAGGFELKAGTDLELPNNILSPIRATVLHDQRMVVAAAGETVQLQIVNPSGVVVGKHTLSGELEADPVLLDDGLVLPLHGRLKLLSLSAEKKKTQDWTTPVGDSNERHWVSLTRIDGASLLACDDRGCLFRIQVRKSNIVQLAEVAKLQLDCPVDLRPILRGEFIVLADSNGVCRQLNVQSFDTVGQRKPTGTIKNLWSSGGVTVLQSEGNLSCLADGKEMSEKWSFDLNGLEPVGETLAKGDAIWFGCRDGTILVLNVKNGKEIRRIQLPQSLSLGLRKMNDNFIAVAIDGTIYSVN